MKSNPVVHFELPSDDSKRAATFYQETFGWKPTFMGPEMKEYVLVATADSNEDGTSKIPGTINGGVFKRTQESENNHPSLVISVDDIAKSISAVTANGGKVIGEPVQIPGVGTYVSFVDTEKNIMSMLQPTEMTEQLWGHCATNQNCS